jgi:predicted RNase H-like HicB family nuclease
MDMRYPVAIERATETACYGVAVPDLPGCFSAGDTLDAALAGAEESAAAWIDATLDAGEPVPPPSSVDAIRNNPEYTGWIFGRFTVDTELLDDTVERVNITLPRRVILRLDALARAAGGGRKPFRLYRPPCHLSRAPGSRRDRQVIGQTIKRGWTVAPAVGKLTVRSNARNRSSTCPRRKAK